MKLHAERKDHERKDHASIIFLYGPPGSGKSTTGKILADNLQYRFFDLDAEIENRSGCTVAQIFARHGESAFREMEQQEIKRLLDGGNGVIALGGGSLTAPAARVLAETYGTVVCLEAIPGVLLERLKADSVQRPLLAGDPAARLAGLLAQRADHYASFRLRIDTTQLDPVQSAWQTQVSLGKFRVKKAGQPYDVCIQPGAIDAIGETITTQDLHGPFALVADSNTAPLYAARVADSLDRAGYHAEKIVIPAGESYKTIDTVQALWENFLDAGLERGSTVIALGGGVVGDLTGFAASTYLRGIQWVNVPTTLLAMVDASLGGKTGVDIARGKNLVGAFHPPALVLTDPDVLATLPAAEFRSGMAEVIKHGIIGDPGLLEMCASVWNTLHVQNMLQQVKEGREILNLVSRSMAVKIGIIETDPYEKGLRAALNYGHTIGHAVELVSEYRLRHGEAVAIGMVVEACLAERLGLVEPGLSEAIVSILAKIDLPTVIPADLDRAAILRAVGVDKKKAQGRVRFALPTRIGRVQIGIDVPNEVLVRVLYADRKEHPHKL